MAKHGRRAETAAIKTATAAVKTDINMWNDSADDRRVFHAPAAAIPANSKRP